MNILDVLLGRSPLRALPVLLPMRGTGDEFDVGTTTPRLVFVAGVGLVLRGFTVSDAGGVSAGDAVKINGANTVARATAQTDVIVGAARAAAANTVAVDIVVYGVISAVADAAISVGDVLGGPSVTAGRWSTRNTFSPAGTVAAPTVNIAAGAGGNVNITTPDANGSALANGVAGAARTGLTGVQAPAFTGTAQNLGVVRGLALTAAAGAGSAFTVFVGPGGL